MEEQQAKSIKYAKLAFFCFHFLLPKRHNQHVHTCLYQLYKMSIKDKYMAITICLSTGWERRR